MQMKVMKRGKTMKTSYTCPGKHWPFVPRTNRSNKCPSCPKANGVASFQIKYPKLMSLHPWGDAAEVLHVSPAPRPASALSLIYSKRWEGGKSLLCTKAGRSRSFVHQSKNIGKNRESACCTKATWGKTSKNGAWRSAGAAMAAVGSGGLLLPPPIHVRSHSRNRHVMIYADASCQLRGSVTAKCAAFTLGSQM